MIINHIFDRFKEYNHVYTTVLKEQNEIIS